MDTLNRVNWDVLWMTLAFVLAQRSADSSTRHACVFVDDNNHILSIGYNSFPRDCIDENMPQTRPEKYKAVVHSETNAIINSKEDLRGATAYITGHPCSNCFGNMLNTGIKKIIYGTVGSHCLTKEDINLIRQMNISATTFKNKIKMIRFEDIAKIEDIKNFLKIVEDYIDEKTQEKDLING